MLLNTTEIKPTNSALHLQLLISNSLPGARRDVARSKTSDLRGVCQFVSIASCPATRHHWESLAPPSLHPSFRHLDTLVASPRAFFSLGWSIPALSAFPHTRGAPVPSPLSRHFVGLPPVCPCLSCTGEAWTGLNAPGVASPLLNRGDVYHSVYVISSGLAVPQ